MSVSLLGFQCWWEMNGCLIGFDLGYGYFPLGLFHYAMVSISSLYPEHSRLCTREWESLLSITCIILPVQRPTGEKGKSKSLSRFHALLSRNKV